jgi:hypothetical protein
MPTAQVYQMLRLDDGVKGASASYDWLLAAGEADARAYNVLRRSSDWGLRFDNVLLCDFLERREPSDPPADAAYRSYSALGLKITLLSCSLLDPSSCLRAIPKLKLGLNKQSKVAIDISSFSRPYCFALLKYLQDYCELEYVDVFYTEPMSYVIPKGLIRSYKKSVGPLSVVEVQGFPGRATGRSKNGLVVTLGFDGDLSTFISDEVTPAFIVIVNGFPAYSPKFKDISLINNERLLNYAGGQDGVSYCRASNPFELFNFLVSLQRDNPDAFFNIAPLGPKPMALGACMFALAENSVRVLYPLPMKYANRTTSDCSHAWRYTVPLGLSLKEGAREL